MARRLSQITVIAMMSAALTLAGTAASADNPGDPALPGVRDQNEITSVIVEGQGQVPELSEASSADIAEYLSSRNRNRDTSLVDRFRVQQPFEDLTTELAVRHRESYVIAGFLDDERADADAWITFTTEPSTEVYTQIATLPLDVEVRYGAAASATELEEISGAALSAITGGPFGVDAAVSSISPDSSEIVVEYKLTQADSVDAKTLRSLEAQALWAAVEHSPDRLLPVPVTIRHEPDLAAAHENEIFGGARLHLASNNEFHCTAGFTGSRLGHRGLITARHCDDLLRFGTSAGWIQFTAIASSTPAGNSIDMQWHQVINGTTASPKFRATAESSYRYASGSANPTVGSIACHWGETSKYSCSTVHSVGNCYFPEGLNYCGLAATTEYISDDGDSGGPWFYGNSARGIHSGWATIGGTTRSLFTAIGHGSTYMATQVLTGTPALTGAR